VVTQSATDPVTGASLTRPHRLVIGLYDLVEGGLRRTRSIETDLVEERTEIAEAVGGPAALVLVNDDDLSYAKVRLDPGSLAAVRAHLGTIPAPLSRALVWSALWNATRDALLPAPDYLDTAFGQAGLEPDAALLEGVLGDVGTAIERYLPAGARAAARARFVDTCRAAMSTAEPGSDVQLTWARQLTRAASNGVTGTGAVRDLLDGTAPDGLRIDADLRWDCWVALSAQGAASPGELDAALAADDTMSGRQAHELALAIRPGTRETTWQRATSDESLSNDRLRALVRGFSHPGRPDEPEYAQRYFDSILGWWASRTMTMATILARGLFPGGSLEPGRGPDQHPVVRQARHWLESHPEAPKALRRIVIEQLADLERALRAQAVA
jgi:aminopeptidase N